MKRQEKNRGEEQMKKRIVIDVMIKKVLSSG